MQSERSVRPILSPLLACFLLLSLSATAQTEIQLPLPPSIEFGQCRPLNVTSLEMQRQWDLHYRFAQRMRPNAALVTEEWKSLEARSMNADRVECFSGTEVFAALCFTVARTKSLEVRALKLIHAPNAADCLAITTVVKK